MGKSIGSDEETDCESNSVEDDQASTIPSTDQCMQSRCARRVEYTGLLRSLLSSLKQRLIDRIMEEFWIIFNSQWAIKPRTFNDVFEESAQTSKTETLPTSQTNRTSSGQKHQLDHGNGKSCREDGDDDDDAQDPKRPKVSELQPDDCCLVLRLACPYRKHNLQTHCILNWRSCALTPFDTVARVK